MSEDIITYSNTPIFDQLASERGYERLIADGPIDLRPASVTGYEAPCWIAVPVQPLESETVSISETVDPEEAEEEYGSFHEFMQHMLHEFAKKYPHAYDVTVTNTPQLIEGTYKVTVSGINPGIDDDHFDKVRLQYFPPENKDPRVQVKKPGIDLKKKAPNYDHMLGDFEEVGQAPLIAPADEIDLEKETMKVRTLGGEIFRVTGESSMAPYFQTEFKTRVILDDLTDRQSELYRLLTAPVVQMSKYADDTNPQYSTQAVLEEANARYEGIQIELENPKVTYDDVVQAMGKIRQGSERIKEAINEAAVKLKGASKGLDASEVKLVEEEFIASAARGVPIEKKDLEDYVKGKISPNDLRRKYLAPVEPHDEE